MLIVVKIGGSCITYKKEGIPKIRYEFLSFFVQEIKKIKDRDSSVQIIIVHGGGSITHPLVDFYNVGDDLKNETIRGSESQISVAKIHLAMNNLNNKITKFFLEESVNVWPVQTSAMSFIEKDDMPHTHLAIVKCALKNDIIPILHGDVVLNVLRNSSIFSGDQVACAIAEKINADRLIFFTDVDGVYEWYDSEKFHGKIVKRLQLNEQDVKFSAEKRDHSGGMSSKLLYIKKHCSKVKNITICNGLVNENITDVFKEKSNVGTIVNG